MSDIVGKWTDSEYLFQYIGDAEFYDDLATHNFVGIEFQATEASFWTREFRLTVAVPVGRLFSGKSFHASAPFYFYSDQFPNPGYFLLGGVELLVPLGHESSIRPTFLDFTALSGEGPLNVKPGLPHGWFYGGEESLSDVEVNIRLF